MHYSPMWPLHRKKTPSLPLGVHIVYGEDDAEELLHLLDFLRAHFDLSEKDFDKKTVNVDERRFPYVWMNRKQVTFKFLLSATQKGGGVAGGVDLGFLFEHQLTLRAYKEHLLGDRSIGETLKNFFVEVEENYFGVPSKMH